MYEEYFITDYVTDISTLYHLLGEYESIEKLNYLAAKIDELDKDEYEKFEGAIELESCNSVDDVLNLLDNLDCFDFLPGVCDDYDLGYYWIEESGCYDISTFGSLSNYFDYESFGRDISLDEIGTFTTQGYVYACDSIYNYDIEIPEEYKLDLKPLHSVPIQATTQLEL